MGNLLACIFYPPLEDHASLEIGLICIWSPVLIATIRPFFGFFCGKAPLVLVSCAPSRLLTSSGIFLGLVVSPPSGTKTIGLVSSARQCGPHWDRIFRLLNKAVMDFAVFSFGGFLSGIPDYLIVFDCIWQYPLSDTVCFDCFDWILL